MNPAEYEVQIIQLRRKHQAELIDLMKQFVDDNNPYKAGDTVTDHVGSLYIKRTGYHMTHNGTPCATYTGVELKKDGTPSKKQTGRTVFQCNIINTASHV